MFTLLLVLFSKAVLGDSITKIHNVNEFITFAKNVNSRKSYSGTTVYLDSDLTLSDKTPEPINNFLGVFDGQGHTISDLKMNSSTSQYTGLFGNSNGLTIKNVVLESSCSITSSYSRSKNVYIGGIIGECYSSSGQCKIENNVNMAEISFDGDIGNNNLYIGGIARSLYSSSHPIYMKNCANYGSITHSGTSGNLHIGGIVGDSYGSSSSSHTCIQDCANYGAITHNGTSGNLDIGGIASYGHSYSYIQNCVNYGAITHNGTSANVYIGGIASYGHSHTFIQNCLNYGAITYKGSSRNLDIGGIASYGAYYTYIENCVSAGKIVTIKESNPIGGIIKSVGTNTHINYCYYTSDVNASSLYGSGTPSSTTGSPSTPTDVDSELVSKLNSIATSRNWNKWFMLHLNGGSINNLAQEPLIGIQGHIPDPVKKGNTFMFWCKDADCTEEFDPESESVNGITDLYAAWASGIVSFDFDNGTTVNETFTYNTEIIYPKDIPKKEGYTFSQWDNYHKLMPARDITVTAQWIPNIYTVTFDFDNGTTMNVTFSYNTEIMYPDVNKEGYTLSWDNYHEFMPGNNITITAQWTHNNYTVRFDANAGSASETSKVVTFNEEYGELPTPTKEGYMFIRWFTDNNKSVTSKTNVATPDNHTLHAHWAINNYTATFNFNNGTGDEVKVLEYNSSVVYPADPVKEGYTSSWDNYHELMPAKDITITAQWIPNNYTVTFDANGGNVSVTSMIVTFNSTYGPLPTQTKEGYMFIGWFIDNERITNETIVTTPYNHTLHAQWVKVTTQVEIVFDAKDLTEGEVEEVVRKYTNAEFAIVEYENGNDSSGVRVIIKFSNNEGAKNFVETIKDSSEMNINKINFSSGEAQSVSSMLCPIKLFNIILFII